MRFILALFLMAAPAWGQNAFATFDKASEAVLKDPHDLAFGPDGMLYIADKFGGNIVIMDPETLEITGTIGDGRLLSVHDVSFGPDGLGLVAVTGWSAVVLFDPTSQDVLGALQGLPNTEGALYHSNGRYYVMASAAGTLVAIEDNEFIASAPGHFGAHDVAEAPDGSIWVADNVARRLVRYSPDLEQLQVLDDPKFGFVGPRYLDIDPGGNLIVADQDAHRILLIDPVRETLLGVLGDGSPGMGPGKFDDPEGVAIRGSTYFFADSDNNRIVRYIVALN